MSSSTKFIIAVAFILGAVGFLLPFWPLCAAGIALLALSGRFVFALGMGVLLDVAYGAPVGRFYFLLFPFTLTAVVLSLARYIGSKYLLKKNLPPTLG